MTGKLFAGASLIALVLSGSTLAADSAGKFAVKGAGITRCSHYVTQVDEKKSEFYVYAGWIEGYLSGVNGYQKDTFDIAPWQNTKLLALMLAAHCRENPQESFAQAVRRMTEALFPRRLREQSEMLLARSGNKGIRLYRAVVEQVQLALADRGLYSGQTDGEYDKNTREAVLAYQKKEKLEENGLPDAATLLRLFNSED